MELQNDALRLQTTWMGHTLVYLLFELHSDENFKLQSAWLPCLLLCPIVFKKFRSKRPAHLMFSRKSILTTYFHENVGIEVPDEAATDLVMLGVGYIIILSIWIGYNFQIQKRKYGTHFNTSFIIAFMCQVTIFKFLL